MQSEDLFLFYRLLIVPCGVKTSTYTYHMVKELLKGACLLPLDEVLSGQTRVVVFLSQLLERKGMSVSSGCSSNVQES